MQSMPATPVLAVPPPAAADGTWRLVRSALRANLLPAVLLWLAALALLAAWRCSPTVAGWLLALGALKTRWGVVYAMVGMAICAGALPYLLGALARAPGRRWSLAAGAALVGFWAVKGIEIDAFYRLQSHLFGDGGDAPTILRKLAFDQLVYAPLWAIPSMALGVGWAQGGMRRPLPAGMDLADWFRLRLPAALVVNWLISLPGVALIYAMPPAVQIPVQNLVICLFSTVLLFLTRDGGHDPDTERP